MNKPRYIVGDILVNTCEMEELHYLIQTIGGGSKASTRPYFYDCLCVEGGWTETWWCHYVDASQQWEKAA